MAVADFCQFVAPYQKLIARMRVVTYTYVHTTFRPRASTSPLCAVLIANFLASRARRSLPNAEKRCLAGTLSC
jgi:hypothetical protein